jgi:Protein of unknown function (DUF1826)
MIAAAAANAAVLDEWAAIHAPDCSLHLERRDPPLAPATLAAMLARPPAMLKYEGTPDAIAAHYADVPVDLVADVITLARRFSEVMGVATVRVRIERTDSNACRKIHADYTDVRLITTYAGPGTDVAPHASETDRSECCLERVPTGWIGLFKGRTYHPDQPPCYHRSPPAGDMGEKRLVLVIDTPARPQAFAP